ncbi:MAG: hypothetical protein AAFO93_06235 [Pseudomonadota bacterium]
MAAFLVAFALPVIEGANVVYRRSNGATAEWLYGAWHIGMAWAAFMMLSNWPEPGTNPGVVFVLNAALGMVVGGVILSQANKGPQVAPLDDQYGPAVLHDVRGWYRAMYRVWPFAATGLLTALMWDARTGDAYLAFQLCFFPHLLRPAEPAKTRAYAFLPMVVICTFGAIWALLSVS